MSNLQPALVNKCVSMCKRYMQNNENKIDILISKKKKVTRHKEYRKAKYIKDLANITYTNKTGDKK